VRTRFSICSCFCARVNNYHIYCYYLERDPFRLVCAGTGDIPSEVFADSVAVYHFGFFPPSISVWPGPASPSAPFPLYTVFQDSQFCFDRHLPLYFVSRAAKFGQSEPSFMGSLCARASRTFLHCTRLRFLCCRYCYLKLPSCVVTSTTPVCVVDSLRGVSHPWLPPNT
jgi:hypothetical protein